MHIDCDNGREESLSPQNNELFAENFTYTNKIDLSYLNKLNEKWL